MPRNASGHARGAAGDNDFGESALMGESRIGKAQTASIPKCLCLFAAAHFSLVYGVGQGVNVCGKIPTDFNVM